MLGRSLLCIWAFRFALGEDADCVGQGCLSMLQQQVVANLEAEDAVEKFHAALEEGDEVEKDENAWGGSSSTYGHYGNSYSNPYGNGNPYGNPYGQSYGNPYGGNPYGHYNNPYGGGYNQGYNQGYNPYSVPGYGPTGCLTKISASSCMIFNCAKSRGPTLCNTQDYYCYCQPGYCSDGHGCMPSR
ncbi:Uncharacterized protein SCF082_LOCUS34465 [Durusdinium trenchii]|uniref:Uncharacterized protein n=1 Tax=Durusdinium trenchii TaxID=1381693 RepID=A0ABP0NY25_9DINO